PHLHSDPTRRSSDLAELNDEIQQLETKSGSGGDDVVMGVRDTDSPANCRINIRGEVTELGDMVPRGFVKVLNYPDSPEVHPKQRSEEHTSELQSLRH